MSLDSPRAPKMPVGYDICLDTRVQMAWFTRSGSEQIAFGIHFEDGEWKAGRGAEISARQPELELAIEWLTDHYPKGPNF